MKNKIKHIVFILLCLFLALIAEKAIPHSHIESIGLVIPDWDRDSNEDSSHHEEESESLHYSFYQLSSFDYSFNEIVYIQFFHVNCNQIKRPESIKIADYNILPKVLINILFIVHTYSSKAPPFYC